MITASMGDDDPPHPDDEIHLDTPHVSVHWESGDQWVSVEWKAWADATEYRAAHEAILGAIRKHRASRLLIDARKARVISDADQQWLKADWIPRAVAAGRRWTAIVMPTSALMKTIVESIDEHPTEKTSEARYFETPDQAKAWLSAVG
jgi:stage II sporulation SpoAA-like protein